MASAGQRMRDGKSGRRGSHHASPVVLHHGFDVKRYTWGCLRMNLHIVLKNGLSNHNALRWASELVIKVFWSRMCFSDDGSPMNRVCKQATWLHWCQGRPISSSSTPFLTMAHARQKKNCGKIPISISPNFTSFTKFHKFYQLTQFVYIYICSSILMHLCMMHAYTYV